jgi:hypothetical protein
MEARVTLRPGQRGTKKLLERFGDRLICVRYRYDPVKRRRVTTVELVVEEAPWEPRTGALESRPRVEVRIGYQEHDLRRRIKEAGGRWNPETRLWILPGAQVKALGLERRVVTG